MTQNFHLVGNEKALEMLSATVLLGVNKGLNQQICQWQFRLVYGVGEIVPECVYDQKSVDTWHYKLDAFKMLVY